VGTPHRRAPKGLDSTAGTDYYVFVLQGIGLVAATPDDVRTRPACQWSGGDDCRSLKQL
jgi:hypothetical protein